MIGLLSIIRCLKRVSGASIEGVNAFLERDPPFFELVHDYEEYHEQSHITSMTPTRLKLIENWIENNSTVLDVGCGECFIAEYLQRVKGCNVKGIDVSARAIEICHKKGVNAEVRDVDIEGLRLDNYEQYDYILFIEVLEHLNILTEF